MLKNYITIALRNLVRQKIYSVINILGLAVGMASCILILIFVQNELSYDQFHTKSDRIYRVLWEGRFGDNAWKTPSCPVPVADVLANFPEVEQATRYRRESRTLLLGTEYVVEKNILFVEPNFFEVFTTVFISGDPKTALHGPDAIVITRETANRYFPEQDPLGQTISLNDGSLLRVTGVVENFPPQSHFHFDMLASLETSSRFRQQRTQWGSATVYTYLVLKSVTDVAAIEAKLREYVENHDLSKRYIESGGYTRFPLQHLADIYLNLHRMQQIYTFSLIAVFILFLACINFVNLATARASNRGREVGIRKVLGSNRPQLIWQFFVESLIYVSFAAILAIGLSELGLPLLNTLANENFTTNQFATIPITLGLIGIVLFVALLAGIYPAFFLAAFEPVKALKAQSARSDRVWLRNGLVIIQFCISIGLLIATLIVRDQIHYMQNKNLGFDKEHVLLIHNAGTLRQQITTFQNQLNQLPYIVAASVTQSLPGDRFDATLFKPEQPANYEQTSLPYVMADEYYVSVLNLKILSGRNFSPNKFATDTRGFLINQSAANVLGWDKPIGKRLTLSGREGQIIGVIEDFHYNSLHSEIGPLVIPYLRWGRVYIAVRLQPGNPVDAIASIRELWDQIGLSSPFEYSFFEQDYAQLYKSEQRQGSIFGLFSGLAIFIASLGLFGLASFIITQRTKEIGIRKVLGATIPSIIFILCRDFALLILVAFTISSPLAYYAMNRWLQNFAYRSEPGLDIFIGSGVAALLFALLTVSIHVWKAACANPVDALRNE